MTTVAQQRKPWYRPLYIVLASVAIVCVLIAWAAYETVALTQATPNPTVNYAQSFQELIPRYVDPPWSVDPGRQAWRHYEEAMREADFIIGERSKTIRDDPERYPPRFEEDEWGPDFPYVTSGRTIPADIEREREVINALRDGGVFDSLDRFAEDAPALPMPQIGAIMNFSPHLTSARQMMRVLVAEMRIAASEGNDDEIVRCFDRVLAIAQTEAYQPGLINFLVGSAVEAAAVAELTSQLTERQVNSETCRELLEILNRRAMPPLELILEGERAHIREWVQHSFSDDGAGDGYLLLDPTMLPLMGGAPPGSQGMNVLEAILSRFFLATRRETVDLIDEFYDACKAEIPLSATRRFRGNFTPETFVEALGFRHQLLQIMLPAIEGAFNRDSIRHMFRHGLRIMLALDMHRNERGDFPGSLEALVPHYLAEVPIDPIHGGPFGYRLLEDDPHDRPFLLYSFGMDGQDDGGYEASKRYDALSTSRRAATGYDFVINAPREELDER